MKKALLLSLAAVGIMAACAAVAWAGEPGAPATTKMSVFDLLWEAGLIGLFIILLSVAGLALTIEHAFSIRREKLLPPDFVAELEDLFDQEDYEEVLNLCDSDDNFLSHMVAASMSKLDAGYESMVEGMAEAGEEASLMLHHKVSYLALIANISPMLGLLGTVVGMIRTFLVFASTPGAGPPELAGGISQALMTTVMGLIVAIPVMVAFQFFRNRVVRLVLESTNIASDIIRRFKPGQRAAG